MRHETAIFGQKARILKFQLSFFLGALFLSVNNKKHKTMLKPLFFIVFNKQIIFKNELKTEKFEKQKCAPFVLKKNYF